jgi:hypothetical protein
MRRERFPDQGWIVADMRTLTLDRRFDGILAWRTGTGIGNTPRMVEIVTYLNKKRVK